MKQLRVSHIVVRGLGCLACKLIHSHLMVEGLFNLLGLGLGHIAKVVETLLALSLTLLIAESLLSSSFSTYRLASSLCL